MASLLLQSLIRKSPQLICPQRHYFMKQRSDFRLLKNHVQMIQSIIGVENILTDDISKYNVDWTKAFKGGTVVCLPNDKTQITNLLKYCNENQIGVVPQGGNTGLVGGGVGIQDDEIILSMSRMNKIISFDENSGVLQCESGCILEALNEYVSNHGYIIPLDLGAKGSCMIGGNISTNAGGLRVIRYGSLHANVLGLEIVLANGEVLDLMNIVQKDNTGYSLKDLFIGAEGTLGVITKVALKLAPKPKSVHVALLKTDGFDEALALLRQSRAALPDILSAFEFFDSACVRSIARTSPQLVHSEIFATAVEEAPAAMSEGDPIVAPVYVLIETSGFATGDEDYERLVAFLSHMLELGLVNDAVISQSTQQGQALWAVREGITSSLAQIADEEGGKLLKFDVSIPLLQMKFFLALVRKSLTEGGYRVHDLGFGSGSGSRGVVAAAAAAAAAAEESGGEATVGSSGEGEGEGGGGRVLSLFNFGHMGDQNLHLNILARDAATLEKPALMRLKSSIDSIIYGAVKVESGSISAEHGIGQLKREALVQSKSATEINLMRTIKKQFDPNGILNRDKIFSFDA